MTLEQQLTQMREATMAKMPESIIKVFLNSLEEIRNDKLRERALQVGDHIPEGLLKDSTGNTVSLQSLHTSEFLVLNFYRGGWCPYCNMELRAYESLKDEFAALGVNIVAISAEVTALAAQTTTKNAISFPILTDTNAALMKRIGIVFQLDEATKREYGNFGVHLDKIQGNDEFELPVPAVYVVNRAMEIVFCHFEEDYMTRLEPSELLEIVKRKTAESLIPQN